MTQRIINDSFWTDPYIEDLDPSEKLIFLYLISNPLCNIAGAYEIKTKRIAYETGFDKDMVEKILKRFEKDGKIMRAEDRMILVNFAKNQSTNPNVLKGMQRIINSIPMHIVKALKGFERLPYFTLLNLTLPNFTLLNSTESIVFEKTITQEDNIEIIETTEIKPPKKDLMTIMKENINPKDESFNLGEDIVKKELMNFYNYWTEKNTNGKKERWEMEKIFNVSRRFKTWIDNYSKFNKNKPGKSYKITTF